MLYPGTVGSVAPRLVYALLIAAHFGACGPVTEVVMLSPAAPSRPPVHPDSVWVFEHPDRALVDYERFALVSADLSGRVSRGWERGRREVIAALRGKAAELGADAVVVEEIRERRFEGWRVRDAYAKGAAVRFHEADSALAMAAARSAGDLRVIAVAPLTLTDSVVVPDSILQRFAHEICDELRAAGFEAVPTATYDSTRNRVLKETPQVGATGLQDADREQLLRRRIARVLPEEYHADGVLYPEIQVVAAAVERTKAEWDGVSQELDVTSRRDRVLASVGRGLIHGHHVPTEIPQSGPSVLALSLVVQIENALGVTLYTERGGFEVLEGVDFGRGTVPLNDEVVSEFERVPLLPDEMFKDPGRIREAVRLALEPLQAGR